MAYGVQVRTADGRDLVVLITPMFVLDFITTTSGSKTYTVPTGKTLKVMTGTSRYATDGAGTSQAPIVAINGNTLTWSNASTTRNIIVYAG